MGFTQSLKRVFSTSTETKENHIDEQLITRYYKSTKDKVIKEIESIIQKQSGYQVSSVSEEHGEIIVHINNGKKAFAVITVIMVKPFRTAVDMSVTTETGLFTDFGFSRKVIYHIYNELDKNVQFVGTGLGEKLIQSW